MPTRSKFPFPGAVSPIPEGLRADPAGWKAYMLGGVPAHTWLERAGLLSSLRVLVLPEGWPYARVNGAPLKYPELEGWRMEDPPLDPGELCRSVNTDDECWLFTCECGVQICGGVEGPLRVAHDEGLTVWICPENPLEPLAVFDQKQYRRAILKTVNNLLQVPIPKGGMAWTQSVNPEFVRRALDWARAGKCW